LISGIGFLNEEISWFEEYPAGDFAWFVRYKFYSNEKSPREKKILLLEQDYSGSEN